MEREEGGGAATNYSYWVKVGAKGDDVKIGSTTPMLTRFEKQF